MDEPLLIVTEIERSAIHDGPGLRTVVFLQGCPLRCYWCCNPETQSARPVLLHDKKRCVGCGACLPACKSGAISLSGGRAQIDRAACVGCGCCASVCPMGVNAMSGKPMRLSDIMDVVRRDRAYYEATGGGLTLSGGEPLGQRAAVALLDMARSEGISAFVETTACVPWETLEAAMPVTDGFFVDYKHPDAAALQRATGAFLATVEENVRRLIRAGARVTLRTPVIPGFNDGEETLERCFAFARALGLSEYVLLPYHSLGRGKYEKLDRSYRLDGLPVMGSEALAPAAELGARMGLSVQIGG